MEATRPPTQSDVLLPGPTGRGYWGVYVTSDEYLPADPEKTGADTRGEVITHVLANVNQESLLLHLRNLDAALGDPIRQEKIRTFLEASFPSPTQERLLEILVHENRALYSEQGLLAAFRRVILDGDPNAETQMDPRLGAILIVQSVLEGNDDVSTSGNVIAGFPEETAISLIANHEFNATTNIYADFDRALRIFEDRDGTFAQELNGTSPRALLRLATGLELESLLSCAMALLANDGGEDPWSPRALNKRVNESVDKTVVASFWNLCSRNVASFSSLISTQHSEWDYFGFEKFPILEFEHSVLLISRHLLLERVTSGLYHFVYEYLESNEPDLLDKWRSAWGGMVEEAIEQGLRNLAPVSLGATSCYFTEHDVGIAYPKSKRCDAVIDFGHTVLAIEIVSSPLSRPTRQGLDVAALRSDLERIVFKKLRQLSSTAVNIAQNPTPLLGASRSPVRIRPLLITGGGFPVNPITVNLVNDQINAEGLFDDSLIDPISIISAEESEYLEAIVESGSLPIDVLAEWRESGAIFGNFTFKNWLKAGRKFNNLRPSRMIAPVQSLFELIKSTFEGPPV